MKRWTDSKLMTLVLLAASVVVAPHMVGCAGGYASYTYATIPPPPLRVETYGPPPGVGYAWIQGYWGYSGNSYVWVPGRWDRPPRGRREWRPGRWERDRDRNRDRWNEGQWR